MRRSRMPLLRIAAILFMFVLFISACNGVKGDADLDSSQPVGEQPKDASIELPEVMGIVLNPDGSPVAYALVGWNELTTTEGVMSGSPEKANSGWIEIDSLGYLTGFTKPYYIFNGVSFFETYVTPAYYGVYLRAGEDALMSFPTAEGVEIEIITEADVFEGSPVQVFASPISTLDVEPRFSPHPFEDGISLQAAFGIMAIDDEGTPIELVPGRTLTVTITPSGTMLDNLSIASFDPERGEWVIDDIRCSSSTGSQHVCEIGLLPPLVGIFSSPNTHTQISPYHQLTSIPSRLGSIIASNPFGSILSSHQPSKGYGSAEEEYKSALNSYKEWLSGHGGSLDPNDPEAREILDDLIDSARRGATENPNETSKNHLAQAAGAAGNAGLPDVQQQLQSEAVDIANDLGRKDLNEGDCGEIKRLLKHAEQIMSLNGDANLAQQLTEKVKEMADDCDIWVGRIRVFMRVNRSHPAGLDMTSVAGSLWIESHELTLWTNVDDYVMHGEDKITHIFNEVTYKREDECKQEIRMSGRSSGQQIALIEGRYDGYTFNINSFKAQTAGIGIVQDWEFEKKDDDVCKNIMKTHYEFPNYVSVILHGFEYGSPPLTLQDMLDEGKTTSIITSNDSIYGFEEINNPDPDLGKYPFTMARVDWTFTHHQKKLPLQEE